MNEFCGWLDERDETVLIKQLTECEKKERKKEVKGERNWAKQGKESADFRDEFARKLKSRLREKEQ